jgi:hypothetical protein
MDLPLRLIVEAIVPHFGHPIDPKLNNITQPGLTGWHKHLGKLRTEDSLEMI